MSITTRFTSNSILNVRVARVGQVNSLGKTMKMGMETPRGISPSEI